MTRRFDAATFAHGSSRRDARGRLVIEGKLARSGNQSYPRGIEHRSADEVFSAESLATYRGSPVLIGHTWVTSENVGRLAVGFVREVRRDGDHVRGIVVLFDPRAIRDVESGELREWSMGYEVTDGPGGWFDGEECVATQVGIKINHAALLPRGGARCGSSCSIEGAR